MYIFEAEYFLWYFGGYVTKTIEVPQGIAGSRDGVWKTAIERALAMESEETRLVGIELIE